MNWRTILKFDENLYRHTNDETKEKHRRILEFIGKQPKGKALGNKIKDFVETGELDETVSPLDLPRNNITPKTREFYGEIDRDIFLGGTVRNFNPQTKFRIVRQRVNDAVTAAQAISNLNFRFEVSDEEFKALQTAISRLIRYYYYEVVPNYRGNFTQDLAVGVEGKLENERAYEQFIANELFERFDQSNNVFEMAADCIVPVLMVGFLHAYPNRAFITMRRGRTFRRR